MFCPISKENLEEKVWEKKYLIIHVSVSFGIVSQFPHWGKKMLDKTLRQKYLKGTELKTEQSHTLGVGQAQRG